MKRSAQSAISEWFCGRRRKPLVLRGARQVGKSTLVRNFAAEAGMDLLEVNLERHPELRRVFASLRTPEIIAELEAISGKPARDGGGTILFLDEIQAVPEAIPALRYLAEDRPELPVLAAGSLLEFALARHSFSMPVGRISYLHVFPMDFREYALERAPDLAPRLEPGAILGGIPDAAHVRLCRLLREYFAVGGMPEAVLAMSDTGSTLEAAKVQSSILQTYRDDFAKYASDRQLALLQRVFDELPFQVGKKAKFVNFSREDLSRDVKACLELLRKAKIFAPAVHSAGNGVPLSAEEDASVWKPIHLDVGLMSKAEGLDAATLMRMDAVRLVNEGAVAEQFVGQHLLAMAGPHDAPSLHYWLREGRACNAEVDFLVGRHGEVIPVEVKSGAAGSMRSLSRFVGEKGKNIAFRFDLNRPSRQNVTFKDPSDPATMRTFELISLPIYAAASFGGILDLLAQNPDAGGGPIRMW